MAGIRQIARSRHRQIGMLVVVMLTAAQGVSFVTPARAASPTRASATPTGASTVPSSVWKWQNPLPQGNYISAIACPSATMCIANGPAQGIMVSSDRGVQWTTHQLPAGSNALTIACPSTSVCFVGGDRGAIARTDDGGQSWVAQNSGDTDNFMSMSCPTTTNCYALGYSGSIVATVDGGAAWVLRQAQGPGDPQRSISCPSALTCYATRAGIEKSTDGGLTWSVVQAGWFSSIACPTDLICYGSGSPVYKTTDGGTTWTPESVPDSFGGGSIVCATVRRCIERSPDAAYQSTGDILETQDGATWNKAVSQVSVDGFACVPGGTLCLGGGRNGIMYRSNDRGQTWAESDQAVTRQGLAAVSCVGSRFCVAVGGANIAGAALVTTNGGSRWIPEAVQGLDFLVGVSCATTRACVAVGHGTIIVTADGTATWKVLTFSGEEFFGVSCPTATTCYVISQLGASMLESQDGGTTWQSRTTPSAPTGLSCPSATVCYVTSPAGGAGTQVMKTTDSGSTWTATDIHASYVSSLSCTSPSNCVAASTCRGCYQAVVTANGGRTWTASNLAKDQVNSVSCAKKLCVAVAGQWGGSVPGGMQMSQDGGTTWTEVPVGDESALYGVSCTGLHCWAVGDNGAILHD